MRLPHLKVKIKTLAVEASFIRKEESRLPKPSYERFLLRQHRIIEVRREARDSLLAYAFLRGKPYSKVEGVGSRAVNLTNVSALALRFELGHGDKHKHAEYYKAVQRWIEGFARSDGDQSIASKISGCIKSAIGALSGAA